MKGMSLLPAKRLILSYIFDWIIIVALAAVGAAFNAPGPYKRPFSLVDLSISFPYVKEQISTGVLVIISLVAPAAIIFLVCLIFVPGPTVSKTPKSLIWRRKFWEWNTGWMGLGLSYALAFFITQGMKNLFGRARPDMLDRCQPDMGLESIQRNTVAGGYAANFDPRWVLVSAAICTQTDQSLLDDGFRSFPSGHSSASWSGLLYLALFLCSKFSITIPFLQYQPFDSSPNLQGSTILPVHNTSKHSLDTTAELNPTSTSSNQPIPIRNQAAAPPVYLLALPLVPISAAIYITSTRYFQFYHHGFDVLFGSLIGILSAWFAFRWYHLPISRGAGWSWGARSRDRAFAIGVGVGGYVGPEGWSSKKSDVRAGEKEEVVTGPGLEGPEGPHTLAERSV